MIQTLKLSQLVLSKRNDRAFDMLVEMILGGGAADR